MDGWGQDKMRESGMNVWIVLRRECLEESATECPQESVPRKLTTKGVPQLANSE